MRDYSAIRGRWEVTASTHQTQRRQRAPFFPIELLILHPHLPATLLPLPHPSFSLPATPRLCESAIIGEQFF